MTNATRVEIVAEARRWCGTPYQHQASLIGVGCDCLGLVRGVWRACVGPEPETPPPYGVAWPLTATNDPLRAAAERHLLRIDPNDRRDGDVLLFRWSDRLCASHVGVLTNQCFFVHAHEGARVAEVTLTKWWRRHLVAVFSFPGVID